MVLSIGKDGDADYYINRQAEYYTGGNEPTGRWYTPDAQYGLRDDTPIDNKIFRDFMAGLAPDGEVIGRAPKSSKLERVSSYDMTFSVSKSVSILWAISDGQMRGRIESIMDRSVRRALETAQDYTAFLRRGAGGTDLVKTRMFGALFQHGESRPMENDEGDAVTDMDLHVHSVIFNLAQDDRGKWYALDHRHMLDWKMALGATHHAELARLLETELGCRIVPSGQNGVFEVGGVPAELIAQFSRRRAQIVESLKKVGLTSADAPELAAAVARATRLSKLDNAYGRLDDPRFDRWVKEAVAAGFTAKEVMACFLNPLADAELEARDEQFRAALKTIAHDITETEAVVELRDVHRHVATLCAAHGRGADDVDRIVAEIIDPDPLPADLLSWDTDRFLAFITAKLADGKLVRLPGQIITDVAGRCRLTAADLVRAEYGIARLVDATRDDTRHLIPYGAVEAHIAKLLLSTDKSNPPPTEEQENGIRYVTTSRGLVTCLEGAAGSGKSVTQKQITALYRDVLGPLLGVDYRVLGCSAKWLTAKAMIEDADLVDEDARAAAKWIADIQSGKETISERTILLVDEAGQMGSRDLYALLEPFLAAGAKVILTGDRAQQRSVGAGPAMDIVASRIGSLRLERTQRMAPQADDVLVHRDGVSRDEAIIQAYGMSRERQRILVDGAASIVRSEVFARFNDAAYKPTPDEVLIWAHGMAPLDALRTAAGMPDRDRRRLISDSGDLARDNAREWARDPEDVVTAAQVYHYLDGQPWTVAERRAALLSPEQQARLLHGTAADVRAAVKAWALSPDTEVTTADAMVWLDAVDRRTAEAFRTAEESRSDDRSQADPADDGQDEAGPDEEAEGQGPANAPREFDAFGDPDGEASGPVNRLRTLSRLPVVRVAAGGPLLLPDHEGDHLVDDGQERPHSLRWTADRGIGAPLDTVIPGAAPLPDDDASAAPALAAALSSHQPGRPDPARVTAAKAAALAWAMADGPKPKAEDVLHWIDGMSWADSFARLDGMSSADRDALVSIPDPETNRPILTPGARDAIARATAWANTPTDTITAADVLVHVFGIDRPEAETRAAALSAADQARLVDRHYHAVRDDGQIWARQAATDFSYGPTDPQLTMRALKAYIAHGRFHWHNSHDDALRAAVEAWKAFMLSAAPGRTAVVLAKSNMDVRSLNRWMRGYLREQGLIADDEVVVKTVARQRIGRDHVKVDLPIAVGDQLLFTRRDDKLDVVNGTIGKVLEIAPSRYPGHAILTVRISARGKDDREVTFDTASYTEDIRNGRGAGGKDKQGKQPPGPAMLEHCYAITNFSVQGMTKTKAFAQVDSSQKSNSVYVATSRATDDTELFASRQAEDAYLRAALPLRQREDVHFSDRERLRSVASHIARGQHQSSVLDAFSATWRDEIRTERAEGYYDPADLEWRGFTDADIADIYGHAMADGDASGAADFDYDPDTAHDFSDDAPPDWLNAPPPIETDDPESFDDLPPSAPPPPEAAPPPADSTATHLAGGWTAAPSNFLRPLSVPPIPPDPPSAFVAGDGTAADRIVAPSSPSVPRGQWKSPVFPRPVAPPASDKTILKNSSDPSTVCRPLTGLSPTLAGRRAADAWLRGVTLSEAAAMPQPSTATSSRRNFVPYSPATQRQRTPLHDIDQVKREYDQMLSGAVDFRDILRRNKWRVVKDNGSGRNSFWTTGSIPEKDGKPVIAKLDGRSTISIIKNSDGWRWTNKISGGGGNILSFGAKYLGWELRGAGYFETWKSLREYWPGAPPLADAVPETAEQKEAREEAQRAADQLREQQRLADEQAERDEIGRTHQKSENGWSRLKTPGTTSAGNYLESRGISRKIQYRYADTIRYGNMGQSFVAFKHTKADGAITGFERKWDGGNLFSEGSGAKSIALFGNVGHNSVAMITRIVITETGVDALSKAQLDGAPDDTLYISTGGQSNSTLGEFHFAAEHIAALSRRYPNAVFELATDRDDGGNQQAAGWATLLQSHPGGVIRTVPIFTNDWNNELRVANAAMLDAAKYCKDLRKAVPSLPPPPATRADLLPYWQNYEAARSHLPAVLTAIARQAGAWDDAANALSRRAWDDDIQARELWKAIHEAVAGGAPLATVIQQTIAAQLPAWHGWHAQRATIASIEDTLSRAVAWDRDRGRRDHGQWNASGADDYVRALTEHIQRHGTALTDAIPAVIAAVDARDTTIDRAAARAALQAFHADLIAMPETAAFPAPDLAAYSSFAELVDLAQRIEREAAPLPDPATWQPDPAPPSALLPVPQAPAVAATPSPAEPPEAQLSSDEAPVPPAPLQDTLAGADIQNVPALDPATLSAAPASDDPIDDAIPPPASEADYFQDSLDGPPVSEEDIVNEIANRTRQAEPPISEADQFEPTFTPDEPPVQNEDAIMSATAIQEPPALDPNDLATRALDDIEREDREAADAAMRADEGQRERNHMPAILGEDFGVDNSAELQKHHYLQEMGQWYRTHFAAKHEQDIDWVRYDPGEHTEVHIQFRDGSSLRDTGDKLLLDGKGTPHKADLMIQIAVAKGQTSLRLRGGVDFKKMLAKACFEHGVEVQNPELRKYMGELARTIPDRAGMYKQSGPEMAPAPKRPAPTTLAASPPPTLPGTLGGEAAPQRAESATTQSPPPNPPPVPTGDEELAARFPDDDDRSPVPSASDIDTVSNDGATSATTAAIIADGTESTALDMAPVETEPLTVDFKPPRTAWPRDFPPVLAAAKYETLRAHPDYRAAKAGDAEAATRVAFDLVEAATQQMSAIDEILARHEHESRPLIIASVSAIEKTGRNKLPLAYANVLAERLPNSTVDEGIVQSAEVHHGGADAYHRMAFQTPYGGDVVSGANYIIVDDTVAMGGTLANLKGHIEAHGGHVIMATTLGTRAQALSLHIDPSDHSKGVLLRKHGPAIEAFCQEEFGYGVECLTEGEAGHLRAAPSIDAIRDRLAAARNEARGRSNGQTDPRAESGSGGRTGYESTIPRDRLTITQLASGAFNVHMDTTFLGSVVPDGTGRHQAVSALVPVGTVPPVLATFDDALDLVALPAEALLVADPATDQTDQSLIDIAAADLDQWVPEPETAPPAAEAIDTSGTAAALATAAIHTPEDPGAENWDDVAISLPPNPAGATIESGADQPAITSRRLPWPADFPPVVTQTSQGQITEHPDYIEAKRGGSLEAALRVATSVVQPERLERLRAMAANGEPPVLVPVHRDGEGNNRLPQAYAAWIAHTLGWTVDSQIVQTEGAGHTGASDWARIVSPPVFNGVVQAGQRYVLVDDNVTLGGTLAALRSHIEQQGGVVLAATTLTAARNSEILVPTSNQVAGLRRTLGSFENVWIEATGSDFTCLTAAESVTLRRAGSAQSITDSLAAAREGRGGPEVAADPVAMGARWTSAAEIPVPAELPDRPLTVLVAGGRGFSDAAAVTQVLDRIASTHGIAAIVHGAAKGADTLAQDYARAHGIEERAFPADWDRFGYAAGPRRNAEMLEHGSPDLLVAFPGGTGTADMTRHAQSAGVPVMSVPLRQQDLEHSAAFAVAAAPATAAPAPDAANWDDIAIMLPTSADLVASLPGMQANNPDNLPGWAVIRDGHVQVCFSQPDTAARWAHDLGPTAVAMRYDPAAQSDAVLAIKQRDPNTFDVFTKTDLLGSVVLDDTGRYQVVRGPDAADLPHGDAATFDEALDSLVAAAGAAEASRVDEQIVDANADVIAARAIIDDKTAAPIARAFAAHQAADAAAAQIATAAQGTLGALFQSIEDLHNLERACLVSVDTEYGMRDAPTPEYAERVRPFVAAVESASELNWTIDAHVPGYHEAMLAERQTMLTEAMPTLPPAARDAIAAAVDKAIASNEALHDITQVSTPLHLRETAAARIVAAKSVGEMLASSPVSTNQQPADAAPVAVAEDTLADQTDRFNEPAAAQIAHLAKALSDAVSPADRAIMAGRLFASVAEAAPAIARLEQTYLQPIDASAHQEDVASHRLDNARRRASDHARAIFVDVSRVQALLSANHGSEQSWATNPPPLASFGEVAPERAAGVDDANARQQRDFVAALRDIGRAAVELDQASAKTALLTEAMAGDATMSSTLQIREAVRTSIPWSTFPVRWNADPMDVIPAAPYSTVPTRLDVAQSVLRHAADPARMNVSAADIAALPTVPDKASLSAWLTMSTALQTAFTAASSARATPSPEATLAAFNDAERAVQATTFAVATAGSTDNVAFREAAAAAHEASLSMAATAAQAVLDDQQALSLATAQGALASLQAYATPAGTEHGEEDADSDAASADAM